MENNDKSSVPAPTGLPKGWENAPLAAQIAYLIAGPDDPELFDMIKADLKGE